MRKILSFLIPLLLISGTVRAQEDLKYQVPPKEILELADFERAPSISMDSEYRTMVFYYRNTYKTLDDLSQDEMRLAGLRINPKTNISSTITYMNNIKFKGFHDAEPVQVSGLPGNARMTNFGWSPDETKIAFTNTTDTGAELWYFDIAKGSAHRISGAGLNCNLGNPFTWTPDSKHLLVNMLPADKPKLTDTGSTIPAGPTVSVSEPGVRAQNRTYQDLLTNATDEDNFDALATSEIYKTDLDGNMSLWLPKAIYTGMSFSPDGKYVMVSTIHRPYSYAVPYNRFPSRLTIYDADANLVTVFNEKPLVEAMPQGMMATATGKRSIGWRSDKPSTVYWVEALDGGDPAVKVDYRDEVFEVDAPFTGTPRSIAKTIDRFAGITWGDGKTAVMYDRWWNTRNTRTYVFNPSNPKEKPVVISDRSYQDMYNDPGKFDTKRNKYGRRVLNLNGRTAYLTGDGYSAEGKFPFVDEINLNTGKTKRIFRSQYTDKVLDIVSIMDARRGEFLVRLQSPTEYPNYYILNTQRRIAPVAVTHFENPFRSIQDIHKEVVKYKREDGVELSGTLYLPAGYDMENKERLPLIMWAYPTEYKDAATAGQSTANPNEFTYPNYGTPLYWVTRGYAILDDAAFPIVGEGDREPNDTFVEQLVANAKAAIDALDELGYIDRGRVAVGGHSYGAFMTANLLTHSDLFAAGIARSGAYNRTLTPFGFQAEERNYWEAPEVYNAMSPFMHADRMKTPMLLIHGGDDNNSGTFTVQSERYFNALKGFGAPARLVILPKESHGYAARESVLHMLWEQDRWLEKYVKNKGKQ